MTLAEATPQIRERLILDKKRQQAPGRRASRSWPRSAPARTPQQAAAAHGLVRVQQAGPFTRGAQNPALGQASAAVGAAFGTPLNQVSGVVETEGGLFIVRPTARTAADQRRFNAEKQQIRVVGQHAAAPAGGRPVAGEPPPRRQDRGQPRQDPGPLVSRTIRTHGSGSATVHRSPASKSARDDEAPLSHEEGGASRIWRTRSNAPASAVRPRPPVSSAGAVPVNSVDQVEHSSTLTSAADSTDASQQFTPIRDDAIEMGPHLRSTPRNIFRNNGRTLPPWTPIELLRHCGTFGRADLLADEDEVSTFKKTDPQRTLKRLHRPPRHVCTSKSPNARSPRENPALSTQHSALPYDARHENEDAPAAADASSPSSPCRPTARSARPGPPPAPRARSGSRGGSPGGPP